jgi:hypothetical protein
MEWRSLLRRDVASAIVVLLGVRSPSLALAQTQKPWSVDVTPYGWLLDINGTTGLRGKTASFNVTFKDILEHLKGFTMVAFEPRYDRWSLGIDVNYVKLKGTFAVPDAPFTDATLRVRQSLVEIGPRYRILNASPARIDLLAGARWWSLGNALTLSSPTQPATDATLNKDWVDPFVGARAFIDLSPRWILELYGDGGGFGAASKSTWQAIGVFSYTISSRWKIRAGYRRLDVNYRRGNDGFIYDASYRAPIVGGTYRF